MKQTKCYKSKQIRLWILCISLHDKSVFDNQSNGNKEGDLEGGEGGLAWWAGLQAGGVTVCVSPPGASPPCWPQCALEPRSAGDMPRGPHSAPTHPTSASLLSLQSGDHSICRKTAQSCIAVA